MQLESRVLSQAAVQEVAAEFVAVKIDPRETFDARDHKTTQYVPELVVLDSRQNFIDSISARSTPEMVRALKEALTKARQRR